MILTPLHISFLVTTDYYILHNIGHSLHFSHKHWYQTGYKALAKSKIPLESHSISVNSKSLVQIMTKLTVTNYYYHYYLGQIAAPNKAYCYRCSVVCVCWSQSWALQNGWTDRGAIWGVRWNQKIKYHVGAQIPPWKLAILRVIFWPIVSIGNFRHVLNILNIIC